ncbi:MAG: hypothetical protein REI78_04845 [Pedobacter sp.]|nr:hypothetical protein [Pedobacter sp.]MDQ8052325.1 hypothetical protein [Pedobacter sp.]
MKKYILLLVMAIAATMGNSYAQVILPTYSGDALRFSQINYGSTARFKAMGNAQIGVGGDISSLGGNPAGLGLFTKSEFTFTPEFNGTTIDAAYLNTRTTSDRAQINLNQIGAVFYMPTYKMRGQDTKKGLVSAVVGLGYSRNNDYGLEANFSGTNNQSSVYNMFDNDNAFTLGNKQSGNIVRSGSVSEFNIAGALNISNQFYIGANVGLVNLRLINDGSLYETGTVQNYSVNYYQNQETKGSGINGRLGVIFRPVPQFRIGANLQTPTWFTIDDRSSVSTDNNAIDAETYDFSYNLRTPLKGSLGASYVIGDRALISADIDFVDYSTLRFSSTNGDDIDVINENNNEVKLNFTSAMNYRFGAEVKITNMFSLRGGYGMNGSAYKDDDDYFATKFYTGGLGYRNSNYYIDLGYQRVETHSTFSPYLLQDFNEPVADAKNSKNNVYVTVGLKF